METARLIKRYPNRKLYDTVASKYVTLDDVASLVRDGVELRIVDNSSGQDLTAVTLAQVLVEDVKRKRGVPLATLRKLIEEGSASLGGLVTQLGRDIDQTVGRVLGRQEQEGPTEPSRMSSSQAHSGGMDVLGTLVGIRDWVVHLQRSIEEWQARVDEQIRRLAESLSPVVRLQRRMSELEDRVTRLEEMTAGKKPEG